MEAEEAEIQFSWLPYIIPALDEIFTATLYFVEPLYCICSCYSEIKGFLAVAGALRNAAQKDWKNLWIIFLLNE